MKCPKCQFENPEGMKFCVECGEKIEIICSKCGFSNFPNFKFCGECGSKIEFGDKLKSDTSKNGPLPFSQPKDAPVEKITSLEGERKHATVLFSDLSGYTAMSEKLDPETVKDIMGIIFNAAGKIADKYDATVEKFFGDEIMIILGVPKAHEDDPVRAINVALEIHEQVKKIGPEYEKETGVSMTMHTGINTGLVVTGDKYIGKSRHGLTGDTINLAKRLTSLADSGEIVVGPDTYLQSSGYFNFEDLKPAEIKGKAEPLQVYRVISPKVQPRKIHRLQGVRAKLIGRKVEMSQLKEAAKKLREGQGTVFSIVGTAGTGKSRLIEEFKESLNLVEIQWREGHAYPYTQNIPYFPLINLLSQAFGIKEGNSPEKIKEKIESGVAYLMGEDHEAASYIGSLFSLSYPEIDSVSPEFWKSKLQHSIQSTLSALANKGPTIICLEDLHWADPSFLELIRLILVDFKDPVLFLCVYRPIITLFTSHQVTSMVNPFQEIHIQDLSISESQDMLESLLNTKNVPDDLKRFVQTKVEGNPFYLEEVINSFIESETLIRKNGNWHVTRPITSADISASIHSVISARLDRLDFQTKRILQQAAVIGRAFYYEILKKITDLKENIDGCLLGLERLDLIKTKSIQPDLEYIFKHALTQEVVYSGLLKKERREIHERIAIVIEQLFQSRLPEFYETLAFHFSRGLSLNKAITYLMKSGKKSLARYSIEESHQYYQHAFELLDSKEDKSEAENERLIELLIEWAYVFYYRGYFKDMADVFRANKMIAESLKDKAKFGMYCSWYGWSLVCQLKTLDSFPWLEKAFQIGEEIKDQRVIGYACTWLTWYYLIKGKLGLSIKYGDRTQKISKVFKSDAYMYFKSLAGLGIVYSSIGDKKKAIEIGNTLVDYGKKHSNIRSLTMGYAVLGGAHQMHGELSTAIEAYEKAVQVGAEPFYVEYIRKHLAVAYIMNGQITEAENALNRVVAFSQESGAWGAGKPAQVFLGAVLIAKGQMSVGLKRLIKGKQEILMSGDLLHYLTCERMLAKIFLQIAERSEPLNLSKIAKNIVFLVKNVPFASKKAEVYLKNVIKVAEEMGAEITMGSASLDLGILYKTHAKTEQAKKCISRAIQIFKNYDAEKYLKEARKAVSSL